MSDPPSSPTLSTDSLLPTPPKSPPTPRPAPSPTPSHTSSLEHSILSLLAAAYYVAASVVLTVVNKLLFSRFPHVHAPLLLLAQAVTTALVLPLLGRFGKFDVPPIRGWTRAAWRVYIPLWVCNVSLLLSSMLALKLTSLLMNNTLRRTGMVFVVAIHCALNRVWPRAYTVLATLLVAAGAVLAGRTDLAFDPVGYGVAFIANLSSATYLVLVSRVRDALDLSNIQLVFVNALTNVPGLALLMLAWPPRPEMGTLFHDAGFCALFGASCLLSIVINHAIFVNTTTNDAVAHTVTGQVKDVFLLALSYAMIDDPAARSSGNMHGVMIGFSGSFLYGAGRLADKLRGTGDDPQRAAEQDSVVLLPKRMDEPDISDVSEAPSDDAASSDDQQLTERAMEARELRPTPRAVSLHGTREQHNSRRP